jgi:hypothetical protein
MQVILTFEGNYIFPLAVPTPLDPPLNIVIPKSNLPELFNAIYHVFNSCLEMSIIVPFHRDTPIMRRMDDL